MPSDVVRVAPQWWGARADPNLPVVDLALGKPCEQSSLSEWSVADEASRAVSGEPCGDFAFHTAVEDQPWWRVDLQTIEPIEVIVVHNRLGGFEERARRIKVEVATEIGEWTLVHAGYAQFGAGEQALRLWLGGEVWARYVSLSLDDRQALHLSKVEVFGRLVARAFDAFRSRHGLSEDLLRPRSDMTPYTLSYPPGITADEVVGVEIAYSGRFGNLFHQCVNAILFAQRTGLAYVKLGEHALMPVTEPFEAGGLAFLPPAEPLPPVGVFLSGEFFNSDHLQPVLGPFLRYGKADEEATTAVAQTILRPHLLAAVPLPEERHPPDELTVHLRSGDIFNTDHPVTYGYRQPPLSFYTLVIETMMREGTVARVRLVFEDRGNPCVYALEAWLDRNRIPYRLQCGTLQEDLSALIDAPHLVFGHGTFGYAACRLSRRVRSVHYFAPELGGRYAFIPVIGEVFEVADAAGGYIPAYQYGQPFDADRGWRNTPAMRQLMLDYPADKLTLRRCGTG